MSLVQSRKAARRPIFDPTPVVLVIGVLLAMLGGAMLLPTFADYIAGNDNWPVFAVSAVATSGIGSLMFLATRGSGSGLSTRQAFIMTVMVWVALSAFGALPIYWSGAVPTYTDAFFESISGLTTTGATVMVDLDNQPPRNFAVARHPSMARWSGDHRYGGFRSADAEDWWHAAV